MLQQAPDQRYDMMSEMVRSAHSGRGLILPFHIDTVTHGQLKRYLVLCSTVPIGHDGRRATGHAHFEQSAEPAQACDSPRYEQQCTALLLVLRAAAGLHGLSRSLETCVPCCSSPCMADM